MLSYTLLNLISSKIDAINQCKLQRYIGYKTYWVNRSIIYSGFRDPIGKRQKLIWEIWKKKDKKKKILCNGKMLKLIWKIGEEQKSY